MQREVTAAEIGVAFALRRQVRRSRPPLGLPRGRLVGVDLPFNVELSPHGLEFGELLPQLPNFMLMQIGPLLGRDESGFEIGDDGIGQRHRWTFRDSGSLKHDETVGAAGSTEFAACDEAVDALRDARERPRIVVKGEKAVSNDERQEMGRISADAVRIMKTVDEQ